MHMSGDTFSHVMAPINNITSKLHFNSFGAKFQTTFDFFNKLSLEKKFIRKVDRLNVKQRRSR